MLLIISFYIGILLGGIFLKEFPHWSFIKVIKTLTDQLLLTHVVQHLSQLKEMKRQTTHGWKKVQPNPNDLEERERGWVQTHINANIHIYVCIYVSSQPGYQTLLQASNSSDPSSYKVWVIMPRILWTAELTSQACLWCWSFLEHHYGISHK